MILLTGLDENQFCGFPERGNGRRQGLT